MNHLSRLFAEAYAFSDIAEWKPELFWRFLFSKEITESATENPFRSFAMLQNNASKRYHFGIHIPKYSFADSFKIYNHDYDLRKNVRIEFTDALLFRTYSYKNLQQEARKMQCVVGDIVDNKDSYILVHVHDWGYYYSGTRSIRDFTYLALPKSYVYSINGKTVSLIETEPEIGDSVFSSKLNPERNNEFGCMEESYRSYHAYGIHISKTNNIPKSFWAMYFSYIRNEFIVIYSGSLDNEKIDINECFVTNKMNQKLFS